MTGRIATDSEKPAEAVNVTEGVWSADEEEEEDLLADAGDVAGDRTVHS